MTAYPALWEETSSIDHLSESCPYESDEIEDYLVSNHYRWSLKEAPTTFVVTDTYIQKRDTERRYWLFQARDMTTAQEWLIVIGSGKSPFDPLKRIKRWLYAKTNDDNLPLERFLEQEYREQLAADSRAR